MSADEAGEIILLEYEDGTVQIMYYFETFKPEGL